MITRIDTEVERAHVHEDALRVGGGSFPACLYLSYLPRCLCEYYINMQAGGKVSLCGE